MRGSVMAEDEARERIDELLKLVYAPNGERK